MKKYFQNNKRVFIISGIVILCIAIATIVATNMINAKKAEEEAQRKVQQESELLEKFKNIYLITTGKYTEEQGECVWGQINSAVNRSDIIDAANEYNANGVISNDNIFLKKIYSMIDNIHQQCNIQVEDPTKNIEKITDIIDITLSGVETSSSDVFELKRGLANISITAPDGVSVELKSTKADWVNCYEHFGDGYPYSEVKTFTKKCSIDYAGEYYFDVHLGGYNLPTKKWTINIRQE